MHERIYFQLIEWGMDQVSARIATEAFDVVLLALVACASYFAAQRILIRIIHRLAAKTRFAWDDELVERGIFQRLSHVFPALAIHVLAPSAFATETLVLWARRGAGIYALLVLLTTAYRLLSVGVDIYNTYEIARRFPIRVYVQVVKILLAAGTAIIAVAILTGQSPLLLLSGLGAMTAILLLISRDSIQGLLAGIQLVSNDMVRPGDWIEMPQYGADGDVMAITLHTVKVRNFDNTITMIPTYALISSSFKNWRGMSESGGRRIKRSLNIDISSVRFCDSEMMARLKRIDLVRAYVEGRQAELADYNPAQDAEEAAPANGRGMTNAGAFRKYLVAYLRSHPTINGKLTLLVRQLQPTEHGLPIEVYAFSSNKNWVAYEDIQSDIFDHIFAILPEFELRAFQTPSGHDAVAALEPLQR